MSFTNYSIILFCMYVCRHACHMGMPVEARVCFLLPQCESWLGGEHFYRLSHLASTDTIMCLRIFN